MRVSSTRQSTIFLFLSALSILLIAYFYTRFSKLENNIYNSSKNDFAPLLEPSLNVEPYGPLDLLSMINTTLRPDPLFAAATFMSLGCNRILDILRAGIAVLDAANETLAKRQHKAYLLSALHRKA